MSGRFEACELNGVVIAIAATLLAIAQPGEAQQTAKSADGGVESVEAKLRLVCDGIRESGNAGSPKRESVTIQLEIFLPSGFFNHKNLTLAGHELIVGGQQNVPRFRVDAESFYFSAERTTKEMSISSTFTVDRYTSFAHEMEVYQPKGREPYFITGEYRCKRIDKPAF